MKFTRPDYRQVTGSLVVALAGVVAVMLVFISQANASEPQSSVTHYHSRGHAHSIDTEQARRVNTPGPADRRSAPPKKSK